MRALVFLMLMFPFAVPAATVINYDDGSTYTLENNERIYVEPHKLFKKKQWSNGGMVFSVANKLEERLCGTTTRRLSDWKSRVV